VDRVEPSDELLPHPVRPAGPADPERDGLIERVGASFAAALTAGAPAPLSGVPPEVRTTALLTPRECEVLCLIAGGLTNREIAQRLDLSVKTVMHHTTAIYRKLAVRGRAEATAFAYRNGLVT
jgi:DNA-binding NarL/FixJ family response regulator